ncbi:MAG: aspartate aminotransferase family protein [Alphaproteobacteria bacterium]|nr:aspartate aminotransferase family protein [Alphaproteobacteria bacterium]MBV9371492.1 aspartate aminotransferase family protein [Alphaproteobacteria bacterium]MBV9902766.1 aspartate aminotransferase family protein [Alphaproteobacteria bacterium]
MTALARSGSAARFEVARTEGCRVFAADGRSAIDFQSGWCVGNLGWSRPEIERALRDFDGPTYVYPGHGYAPWEELARALVGIAPPGLQRCFRATGGSEAVEIALQAAMLHTGRARFVTVEDCYHGDTLGPRSIGDGETRNLFPRLGLPAPRAIRPPLDEARLAQVETALKRRDVAAMILEPVICNLGALVPEPAFMRGSEDLCRRYGTLLILDEVATGFGRTGRMFAAEHSGVRPDILTLAKAVTAGFAPMGATLMRAAVADSMLKAGAYSTYGWHPRSTAAALANLAWWRDNKETLLAHVAEMGGLFAKRLAALGLGPVQGAGLALGVRAGSGSQAERIKARCLEEGLIVAAEGDVVTLFPPLVIDEATALEGLDILERCAAG